MYFYHSSRIVTVSFRKEILDMQAIILAAGIGKRLGEQGKNRPKALLEFGKKSLLERHIKIGKSRSFIKNIKCMFLHTTTNEKINKNGIPNNFKVGRKCI